MLYQQKKEEIPAVLESPQIVLFIGRLPLLMQFPFKAGAITIARLSQADEQTKLIIGSGEMLDRLRPFTWTCGVFRFDHPTPQVLETIMSIGMEHHISFAYGDYRAEWEVIAKLLGLPVINL